MNAICNSFRPWLVTAGGEENTSALELIHATCIPVIGVHEIHGRVGPNYRVRQQICSYLPIRPIDPPP